MITLFSLFKQIISRRNVLVSLYQKKKNENVHPTFLSYTLFSFALSSKVSQKQNSWKYNTISKCTEIHPFKVVIWIKVFGIYNIPSAAKPDKLYGAVCIFNMSVVNLTFGTHQFRFEAFVNPFRYKYDRRPDKERLQLKNVHIYKGIMILKNQLLKVNSD